MLSRTLLLTALLLVACKSDPSIGSDKTAAAPSPSPAVPSAPKLSFVPAGEGEVSALVLAETQKAKSEGARLVVYVGATWCEPCRRFHERATSGALDAAFPRVRFLEFDLDRDEARLKAAGYTSELIPLFAVPAADGRASGKQISGSVKGPGSPAEITPRLQKLLADTAS